jgi:tetratricopeptide (TPR) repeat protein
MAETSKHVVLGAEPRGDAIAKYTEAFYYQGNELYKLGACEEAISYFDKVLEIDPNNVAAWNSKGLALSSLEMYDEAIRCFDKSLSIYPSANTWYTEGLALNKLGRYYEAIRCFDKALEIDPYNDGAWNSKGITLFVLDMIKMLDAMNKSGNKSELW